MHITPRSQSLLNRVNTEAINIKVIYKDPSQPNLNQKSKWVEPRVPLKRSSQQQREGNIDTSEYVYIQREGNTVT